MPVTIKHNFVSPITDEHNPGEVGPDEWNDDHQITGLATVAETGAYSDLSGTPTLGTAAALNVGVADGDVVQVQAGGKLPALDGSDLTNLPSGGGAVDSVNGQTGTVVLDPDDLDDTSTTHKFTTASDISKLAAIEANADVTDAANVGAAGAFMKSSDDADDVTEGASHLFLTGSERSAIAGLGSTYQPLDSDLTAIAGLSPTNDDIVQRKAGAWANRTMAQLATDLGLAASYQPLDSDLTSWASVTRASGYDTFAATPSSANLAALLTDETGTGAAVFATAPTLSNPIVGTQSDGDNSTKAASTAYVDRRSRKKLTGALTIYADFAAGSNSNDGLGTGTALKDIQSAYNLALTYDCNGNDITLQMADSTSYGALNVSTPLVGGNLIVNGNSGTPANVKVAGVTVACGMNVKVQNFQTAAGFADLNVGHPGAKVEIGAGFGTVGTPLQAHIYIPVGYCFVSGSLLVSGSCRAWLDVSAPGKYEAANKTITFASTPAWSGAGIYFTMGGQIVLFNVTMSGSATGKRYEGTLNAVMNSFGAGSASTYFPGNSNGTTATGAQAA